jgi:hypothetical protein
MLSIAPGDGLPCNHLSLAPQGTRKKLLSPAGASFLCAFQSLRMAEDIDCVLALSPLAEVLSSITNVRSGSF